VAADLILISQGLPCITCNILLVEEGHHDKRQQIAISSTVAPSVTADLIVILQADQVLVVICCSVRRDEHDKQQIAV
ncbi:hypothetical protein J6590_100369, partial [Homalodisca vitripennis]